MRIIIAVTGASRSIYARRLSDNLDLGRREINVVQSNYAQQVIATELPEV